MQTANDAHIANDAERVAVHRREVVTVLAFAAFLLAGITALGIYALIAYA